ncbi:hypothetical protein [Mycolicibacterium llatzerense]|uniref:Core-binding (CB) domain-containing protein n=1 Tax=Mycolicibacterium llatzerense TaxID=280871 RepID=A0A0D1LEW8_9MYCO|nr:hypothetical protein [Mycolicibacterium llatzerense]KIU14481.1 hypothetical protein TL10_24180 [Mycolicibacterium llatzerense]
MPAKVIQEPLAVEFAFPNGTSCTIDFARLPNQQLAHDLARGLATLVHPHGRISRRATAQDYAGSVRRLVTVLADGNFSGGASDLTAAQLLAFWMAHSHHHERRTRLMLLGIEPTIATLDPTLRAHLNGRLRKQTPKGLPYRPYTSTEWQRLTECCTDIIDSAWQRHHDMLVIAKKGRSPRSSPVSVKSLGWLMLRRGPMSREDVERFIGRQLRPRAAGVNYEGQWVRQVRESLFPTLEVQIAYRLLFGIQTGIVPDGIDDLGIDDIHWAGDSTVLLSYVKGRTTGEGLNLTKGAVRLLKQWLDHSDTLRRTASQHYRGSLWLAINSVHTSSRVMDARYTPGSLGRFSRRHELVDDSGEPLHIHRGRIRATFLNMLAMRGWTGRTTIDPNHSAAVEGDHYLTAATPAQRNALESVIEEGQADLVRRALPATVFTGDEVAQLVARLPAIVAELVPDAPTIADLVGGKQDVFVAACADQLSGLWGPKGQPCPSRPWVCLMCPLAVFLPRHAPNLLRLKSFFARQFRRMPTDQYLRVFGPYADRLDSDILPQFSSNVLASAAAAVNDLDSEIPLGRVRDAV